MLKAMFVLTFCTVLFSLPLCADKVRFFNLADIRCEADLQAEPQADIIIIECPEGTQLPIGLDIFGDIMELVDDGQEDPITIRLLKTMYIKINRVENSFMVSSDMEHWQPAYRFCVGSLGLSFGLSHDGKMQGMVTAQLYERVAK